MLSINQKQQYAVNDIIHSLVGRIENGANIPDAMR